MSRAPAPPGPPLSVTWPPPDRELDRYDVVDVPEDDRTTSPAPATPPTAPAPATPQAFARPDWGELRLRSAPAEPPARSPWLGILATLLALVALAEGAYIWFADNPPSVVEDGHLRVDGPEGAEVRLDGERVGRAPLDQDLAPGVYQVEVLTAGQSSGRQRVPVGPGRTVVLLPMGTPPALPAASPVSDNAGAPASPVSSSEPPSTRTASDATVSDTTGAIDIDSTPTGLPVTMGGRPRGVTPLTVGQVKPGRHDVMVGGLLRQVDVRAGQVTTLRVAR